MFLGSRVDDALTPLLPTRSSTTASGSPLAQLKDALPRAAGAQSSTPRPSASDPGVDLAGPIRAKPTRVRARPARARARPTSDLDPAPRRARSPSSAGSSTPSRPGLGRVERSLCYLDLETRRPGPDRPAHRPAVVDYKVKATPLINQHEGRPRPRSQACTSQDAGSRARGFSGQLWRLPFPWLLLWTVREHTIGCRVAARAWPLCPTDGSVPVYSTGWSRWVSAVWRRPAPGVRTAWASARRDPTRTMSCFARVTPV